MWLPYWLCGCIECVAHDSSESCVFLCHAFCFSLPLCGSLYIYSWGMFKPVDSLPHTQTHSLYSSEEVRCLVACMPPVVGSSLILGLLHQSWSWQQRDLLSHVQATKTKQKQTFIIWNWLEELGSSFCQYRLIYWVWFIFLMSVAEQCGRRKNGNALLILFHPFLLFHFILFCQNVATVMTGRKELKRFVNSSQPITIPGNVN